jgi:hypothetical protein
MQLRIFAYHVACIMGDPAPAKFDLSPVEGLRVDVEIVEVPDANKPEGGYDHCKINGKWAGNRHGAVQEFARLVAEHVAKPAEASDVEAQDAADTREWSYQEAAIAAS